jgi:hypothetical protein
MGGRRKEMNTHRKIFTKKEYLGKVLKPLAIIFFVAFSYTYATGQILNITVPMSAAEENPPTGTAGIGTGALTFDPATNTLSGTVTFSGLSTGATDGHVHLGAVGVNGGVVIPLDTTGALGLTAGTMALPPTDLDLTVPPLLTAFNNNDLYLNIHTTTNPGGEIRGQIIPNGTFSDVPQSGFAFTQIEQIAGAGITGGCAADPPRYCPDNPITRGQMAVFLEVSAGRGAPVACTGTRFTDVTPTSVGQASCDFIEAFADAGITGGCGPGIFCPNDPVTRGQMAVFIETAIGGVIGACAGTFNDVLTTDPFCGFIERLALDGITGGCGPGVFCPNNPVTRSQMAVFLVTAPILLP